MKKLILLLVFLTLFMINLSLVYSIYSSEKITENRLIERTGDEVFSELKIDNKSYDVQLAMDLREAGIQFNSQDLVDYYSVDDIPLLIEYDSPVPFGAEIPLKGKKKQTVSDLSSAPENIDKINSIKSVTTSLGGQFKKSFKMIPYVALGIPRGKLKQLASNLKDTVKKFYVDSRVHIMLNESIPLIKADEVWSMVDPSNNPIKGTGVKIAIIDTGIDKTHPDLDDLDDDPATTDPKVIAEYDFVNDDNDASDDDGHGTHCAGIAAGTGEASKDDEHPDGKFKGVAPGANLLAAKVLDSTGSGTQSWVISGIEWAVVNEADVISMSLGAYGEFDGTDPVSQAVDTAVDNDVVVVVAAGNLGGRKTIGSPGVAKKAITVGASYKTKPISEGIEGPEISGYSSPSEPLIVGDYKIYSLCDCANETSHVVVEVFDNTGFIEFQTLKKSETKYFSEAMLKITLVDRTCEGLYNFVNAFLIVHEITLVDGYHLAEFSSRGYTADGRMKPDIIAPGVDIVAARASGATLSCSCCSIENDYYVRACGTSMATPHVAGLSALILQAHPDWTPEQIKSTIIVTAKDIDLNGISLNVLDQGNGGIDAEKAVNALVASSPPLIDFGLVGSDTILTKTFTLINLHDEDLYLDLTTSDVKNDEGIFPDVSSLSVNNLVIEQGGSASVTLTVDISSLPDYPSYGHVIINVNGQTYRIPFSFFIKSRMIFEMSLGSIVPTIDGIIDESEWSDANVYTNLGEGGNYDVYLKSVTDSGEDSMYIGIRFKDPGVGTFNLLFDEGDDGLHGSGTRDYFLRAGQEDRKVITGGSMDGYSLGWVDYGIWWCAIGYDPHYDFRHKMSSTATYTDLELKMPFNGVERDSTGFCDVDQSDLNVNYGDSIGFHWEVLTGGGWNLLPENSNGYDALTYGTINILTVYIPDSCDDTDGGFYPKVKGIVSGYQAGEEYSYTDYCLSSTSVNEYYCSGTSWSSGTYDCKSLGSSYICSSGGCRYTGGGGCPTLFVYDGKDYVKERKSRIHSQEGVDVVDEIVLKTKPIADNGVYSLSLKETTLPEHSYIDSVRLFVIDSEGKKEAKLLSAMHSRYGDVTEALAESDDVRTDTKVFDSIELKFEAPELEGEAEFLFTIEGYNPALEITGLFRCRYCKLDVSQAGPITIIAVLAVIVVIFGLMKIFVKRHRTFNSDKNK